MKNNRLNKRTRGARPPRDPSLSKGKSYFGRTLARDETAEVKPKSVADRADKASDALNKQQCEAQVEETKTESEVEATVEETEQPVRP